jgi:gamma-butyrobetaine dioxygenase/trimethyllysine dioxygenase
MAARILPRPEALRVDFGDGHHADFHWFWLRHECSLDRHPTTGERTLSMAEVPLDVQPSEVRLDGERARVLVRWRGEPSERALSAYPLAWLREHAYALDRDDPAPLATTLTRYLAEPAPGRALPADFRERLARDGALVVRAPSHVDAASPEHTERVIAEVEATGLSTIGTHFGRIEDLRTDNTTNQNTDQLGYTDAAVDLHTDQPFLDVPPRFQLLHAIRPAPRGGESLLADASEAARWLEATDAHAFELLTTVPVRFHRKQKAFEKLHVGPILERRGERILVRASYFTMAPHRLPFAKMEAFYRAYRTFFRHIAEPRHHLRFLLGPGEILFYDNRRMLHGRTPFEGARWVRGVYFDVAAS